MRLVSSVMLFVICWSFISFAQTAPSPAKAVVAVPAASAAPVVQAVLASPPAAQHGVMAWVESHGGFQGAVLLLVFSAMTLLSALRAVLKKWDGIAEGDAIPADNKSLTLLNKVCMVLGTVIDYVQGNLQH